MSEWSLSAPQWLTTTTQTWQNQKEWRRPVPVFCSHTEGSRQKIDLSSLIQPQLIQKLFYTRSCLVPSPRSVGNSTRSVVSTFWRIIIICRFADDELIVICRLTGEVLMMKDTNSLLPLPWQEVSCRLITWSTSGPVWGDDTTQVRLVVQFWLTDRVHHQQRNHRSNSTERLLRWEQERGRPGTTKRERESVMEQTELGPPAGPVLYCRWYCGCLPGLDSVSDWTV